MKLGSTQIGVSKTANQGNAGKRPAGANRHQAGCRAKTKGEVTMQPHARAGRWDAVAAHPLAELLACPPATGSLLNDAATCIDFDAGAVVFRQAEPCRGLYVAVSGRFQRKTERLETRLTLGPVRVGDLVELAASSATAATPTPSRANRGFGLAVAHRRPEPGISTASAAPDAIVGGTCPRSIPGI